MKSRFDSRYILITGKIISSLFLLFIIFAWTFFLIAIVPIILFAIYHSKGKNVSGFKFAMAMTPVIIIGTLIWRMWSPDRNLTKSEKEYFKGMMEGHAEGSYAEGKRQGYMMVSREEDLAPIAKYYGKRV